MNIRILSALAAGAAMFCAPAHAAVTVIGSGPAEICYHGAESGSSPFDDVKYCNEALSGILSVADRAATYVNRGVLRLAMNNYDAAAADFDAGLAINAGLGEAYVDRGAALIAKKRFAEALADISKGLALGTKEPQNAYFDRAIANEAMGNIQAAYEDYRQALTLEPGFTAASQELTRFKVVQKPSGT
ncbi:MAG TPA: hypothetical protein VII56_00730 [Rhizomicrobium sp.]